jgi:hypothetical protein
MKAATSYFNSIKPSGISNKINFEPELAPHTQSTTEIPLSRALKLAAHPEAPLNLKTLIDEAVAFEMHKVTTVYDTIRRIGPSNPIEPDAIRVHSLMFIKFKRDGRVTARLAACGNEQPDDSFSNITASMADPLHG